MKNMKIEANGTEIKVIVEWIVPLGLQLNLKIA